MNATTSQSFSPLPNLAGRAVAFVRQQLRGEHGRVAEKAPAIKTVPTAEQEVFVTRRIQAISSAGRQSAGLFGKTSDSVNVVRVSTTAKSGESHAISANTERPRFAHIAARSSKRIVIIR